MPGRDTYSALEAIDKITSMRNEGYSEADIAKEFGFTNRGRANIGMFRNYIQEKRMEARVIKAQQLADLMNEGYSLEEAAEKMELDYSSARALSLWHQMNKGE